MVMTWLIVNCKGMRENIREVIMDATIAAYNPRYYEETPWLEDRYGTDEAMPTIQIYCESQKEALRLRKMLRTACVPYEERYTHHRKPAKELVINPLDSRILLKYTDEDGNDLQPEQMPARATG